MISTHMVSERRIAELDGLRGIAVGMVLVWHFVGALIDQGLGGWTKLVYGLTIFGRTGVDLFFVLSGFLITGILLDRRQSPARFLQSFYVRRLLRIAPSYLVLVAIFWAAVAAGARNDVFNSDTPLWHHLTFTQNWWMAEHDRWGPSAISVTWSVAIEEQFYLAFPLMVLLTPYKRLPVLLLAIALGSAVFRAMAWLLHDSAFTMYVHTLSRLDGLAAGAVIAWACRHQGFEAWMTRHGAALQRLFTRLLWLIPLFLIAIRINLPLNMALWGHSYLTVVYALAVLLILKRLDRGGIGALRQAWLTRLGAVSYTVYLFHPLFLACAFLIARRPERVSTLYDAGLAAAALCATLIWAAFSLKFLERPLTKAGRKLRY
ncbi:acyltransferase family protein [Hydrogenophaga crocea]|uniref:Acyltransferase n=1 Tax=Hydrogenophaga crocea TaxID=2716225 RepID=A0A6G8ILJ4_9BURK|nr:acyltransferase [Hydrogenophaga crocea]QIM53989.1 acyltransferase [Hydrogenophaga crocea]